MGRVSVMVSKSVTMSPLQAGSLTQPGSAWLGSLRDSNVRLVEVSRDPAAARRRGRLQGLRVRLCHAGLARGQWDSSLGVSVAAGESLSRWLEHAGATPRVWITVT